MSTKASTAALDQISQRLFLPSEAFRTTRLAVMEYEGRMMVTPDS